MLFNLVLQILVFGDLPARRMLLRSFPSSRRAVNWAINA